MDNLHSPINFRSLVFSQFFSYSPLLLRSFCFPLTLFVPLNPDRVGFLLFLPYLFCDCALHSPLYFSLIGLHDGLIFYFCFHSWSYLPPMLISFRCRSHIPLTHPFPFTPFYTAADNTSQPQQRSAAPGGQYYNPTPACPQYHLAGVPPSL